MAHAVRNVPNILVTGTPGVGKSALSVQLAEAIGLNHVDISKVAIENNCLEEYDEVYKCPVLDEDKLLDGLEETMCKGGNIVDYHSCEFFPERWFDLVIVLRTNNTTLYDRLTARGYAGKKLEDNVDCEIFQVILEEAQNSYKAEIVQELQNTTLEDLQRNIQQISVWIRDWLSLRKQN